MVGNPDPFALFSFSTPRHVVMSDRLLCDAGSTVRLNGDRGWLPRQCWVRWSARRGGVSLDSPFHRARVWCPSCGGRRMADTAAHLVDRVFPIVPVRQWVLSLPFALRYRMAYDRRLTSDILNVFIRALFGELRRRAERLLNLRSTQCWRRDVRAAFWGRAECKRAFSLDGDRWSLRRWREWPSPVSSTARARGSGRPPPDVPRQRARSIVAGAERAWNCGGTSTSRSLVRRRSRYGRPAGQFRQPQDCGRLQCRHGVVRMGDQIDPDGMDAFQSPLCTMVSGFSVHANVAVEARDRMRMERLMRYAARPAVATHRLSELSDGRLHYLLKRPWRDGTIAVVFERQDFIAKLAVLVPAPRAHLTRYHGVFGPAATWRSLIVPNGNDNRKDTEVKPRPSSRESTVPAEPGLHTESSVRDHNYTWAELMKRIFLVDVLQCEHCGGRMKILAAIRPPTVTVKILECLGLPSRAPPLASASSDYDCQPDAF